MTFGCGGCDKQWGGLKAAHCARCHLTFTTPLAFDAHQKNLSCLDPSSAGLVYVEWRDAYRFMTPEEERDSNDLSAVQSPEPHRLQGRHLV